MLKKVPVILILLLVAVFVGLSGEEPQVQAQDDDPPECDVLVQEALQEIASVCIGLGRNEICYGNATVSATLKEGNEDLFFEAPGDIVPITALEAVFSRPSNVDGNEWGIALMDVQADLPNDDDGVRIVVLGGTTLTPAVETPVEDLPTCTYINDTDSNLNMRALPNTSGQIVDILDIGDSTTVYGRNGEWLRSARGWVVGFGSLDCDVSTLTEMTDAEDAYVAPMQSFTLEVTEDAQCRTAPSGMLIQTPEGQTANIMVNNVELRVGSTAWVTTRENNSQLAVGNFEGNVYVTADGETQALDEETQSTIPLENNQPSDAPSDPEPFYEGFAGDIDTQIIDELVNVEVGDTPDAPTDGRDATLVGNVLNVRAEPGLGAPIIAVVQASEPFTIVGQLPDGSWLRIQLEDGSSGWIFARLVVVNIDLDTVPIENVSIVAPPQELLFTADRSAIRIGECITLSWSAEFAEVVVYQDRVVGSSGSQVECPTLRTSIFTVTATWPDGETQTQSITVIVDGGSGY